MSFQIVKNRTGRKLIDTIDSHYTYYYFSLIKIKMK